MQPTTSTATVGAYDLLRDEILHGALMPGERLRIADLNARYNLGLTPIREALMQLATEGFLESEPHRGVRVRDASVAELHDLMETRRTIERLCLTRAIARGDAVWEAEIVRAMYLLSRAPLPASPEDRETADHWETLHRQLHFALVAACGSEWHLRLWGMLVDHSARYRKLRLLNYPAAAGTAAWGNRRDGNAEHETIVEAALARDTDRAVVLLNEHLQRTEDEVAHLLTTAPPSKKA